MPFISQKDNRQRMQTYTPAEYIEVPEFSEVFNASVGLAIDEGLSISGYLNNVYKDTKNYLKCVNPGYTSLLCIKKLPDL